MQSRLFPHIYRVLVDKLSRAAYSQTDLRWDASVRAPNDMICWSQLGFDYRFEDCPDGFVFYTVTVKNTDHDYIWTRETWMSVILHVDSWGSNIIHGISMPLYGADIPLFRYHSLYLIPDHNRLCCQHNTVTLYDVFAICQLPAMGHQYSSYISETNESLNNVFWDLTQDTN